MNYYLLFGVLLSLQPVFSVPIAKAEIDSTAAAADSRTKRKSNYAAVSKEYNPKLFQGDIVLPASSKNIQLESALRAVTWPNGVVPYTIDIFDSEGVAMIEDAMREFREKTCVNFVPKSDSDEYFIRIVANDGCSSTVGRNSFTQNGQEVSLSDGCYNPGTIRHELMHVLGFFHEQSRTDRDNYVRIVWENIQSGLEDQFAKNNAREVTDLGSPYDYGSLMHYSSNAFSRDESSPTITKIDGSTSGFGQRRGFSEIDLLEINKLYNCPNTGSGGRQRPNEFGGSETTTVQPEETTESRWGRRRPNPNRRGGRFGSRGNNRGSGGFGGGFGGLGNGGIDGSIDGIDDGFFNRPIGSSSGFRRGNGGFGAFGGFGGEESGHGTEESTGDSWFSRWVSATKENAGGFFG
uniref:Metalloendopeptidase n=1 Tax=Plectus sambesii TaxID=2011161 RepID=A0A914UNM9_9BILA